MREEKDKVVFDESMKQREEPEKKDGGPFDPSKNEQNIEKKEEKNLKRDEKSFTCVREEKDKAAFDESTKQREEPEKKEGGPLDPSKPVKREEPKNKDGGPFDPSKNEQSIEKKEEEVLEEG